MSKTPKYNGRHEKSSAAQTQKFISAKLESGPTTGGTTTPLWKTGEDSYVRTEEEKKNASSLPSELHPKITVWSKIVNVIVGVITILGFLGGIIFWFARLDSKVEATALDMGVIKPKVDQLLITSEEQGVKLDNLEKKPFENKGTK